VDDVITYFDYLVTVGDKICPEQEQACSIGSAQVLLKNVIPAQVGHNWTESYSYVVLFLAEIYY
jgi:hypothetical protein